MHQQALAARAFVDELADGFEKRQPFDIANGAADFTQHEINLVLTDAQELFDFIGDMRDHLNGFAQIIAAPFFLQHGRINPARRHAVGFARRHAGEPFVMAKVQIGFGAIIGHKHLAMFKRRHGAGIDVQIGVEFAQPHRIAPRLQQRPQCGRGEPLAKRGYNAASDENIACHRLASPVNEWRHAKPRGPGFQGLPRIFTGFEYRRIRGRLATADPRSCGRAAARNNQWWV